MEAGPIPDDVLNSSYYQNARMANALIQVQFVPLDPNNTDYAAILEWVADGNTIEEAD
jgi:hypothetical protein